MIGKTPLVLSLILLTVLGAPSEDQVHLAIPYTGHRWYSGYLNFTHGAFHYVFFDSQRDPDNDPVILWLNGGPGCSSLIGMVHENGPFTLVSNTTYFQPNDYAWNKKANLLYIQTPQGVGFSVGTPQKLDDPTVATYNLRALLHFFVKFPNLKKNELYISGSGYSGTSIPYLANQIIKYNKLPSSKQKIIKLKGILIGNGCTDPSECYTPGVTGKSVHHYQFLYKHTYITERDYDHMRAVCILGYHGKQCVDLRKTLDKKFSDTNSSFYNIYAPCYFQQATSAQKLRDNAELSCEDNIGIVHFFNQPLLFQKLHVNPIHFEQCNADIMSKYIRSQNASYWLYPTLIKQGLRIWIYSGDVDPDVPITGTLKWIDRLKQQLGLPVIEPWRQWWVTGLHKHEDQVGGMVWQIKNLTFALIKGAGHFVPRDKPKQTYVLVDSFLNGAPLPEKSQ